MPTPETRAGGTKGTGGTGRQGPLALQLANSRSRIAPRPPMRPSPTRYGTSLGSFFPSHVEGFNPLSRYAAVAAVGQLGPVWFGVC